MTVHEAEADETRPAPAGAHLEGPAGWALMSELADPTMLLQRLAEQTVVLLGRADGCAVGLVHEDEIAYVSTAGTLAGAAGARASLDGSLAGASLRAGRAVVCNDTEADDRLARDNYRWVGARSVVCVPLLRPRQVTAVLTVTSRRPAAFASRDLFLLDQLTPILGAAVGAAAELADLIDDLPVQWPAQAGPLADSQHAISEFLANVLRPGMARRIRGRDRIEAALEGRRVTMVCQPILDLTDGTLMAAEALARFEPVDGQLHPPDVWFADAHRLGLGVALELTALRVALELMEGLPAGARLAVNLGPTALATREAAELIETVDPQRTVIELTEHVAVVDYPGLRLALERLRGQGARLAIDDTGAGVSSLSHILRLAPDYIKLDRDLTAGIDADPARRALADALVRFAADSGAQVVAEGIETTEALSVISDLGITYGQGFYIGRPGPPERLHDFKRSV